ncbi:heparinase II/III family protein [Acuticoccus sp. MNP-M23]|uniref:heparinase II/III family protein n=1 Tax=Acuticoccus sp. MNP-M23 TaxID=3072793 RepID=UPI002814F310|nr:heparinase II/III family protein [Acuticoccus sp. MNP-M23]WMS42746.1 heparinase II/III family protein [Acuticoccus sp. MNP-M23]
MRRVRRTHVTLPALAGQAIRVSFGAVVARAGAALWRRTHSVAPQRILFAPESLAECDAAQSSDIYAGVFQLAGETVDTAGGSPFTAPPPSEEWAKALHSFTWLVHLEATASPLSSSNARALVEEWLVSRAANGPAAQDPAVMAARLTAFLVESPLLLSGAEATFRADFLRALGRHMRKLERLAGTLGLSLTRAEVLIALALAGTVIADQTRLQKSALAALAETLEAQVLPDGGHASRSPQALARLLTTLIPLREALLRRQQPVPPPINSAIDRMMPMLRFFQHADGRLAAFHGGAPTPDHTLDAIESFDEVQGRPTDNARYSGFQRLEAGGGVVLFDTGVAPPPPYAREACASALSFEYSHEGQTLVGNCGALGLVRPQWARASRATAAHTTLTLANRSSARILSLWPLTRVFGPVLFGGPRKVDVTRDALSAAATHDGYHTAFGITHERTLVLSGDGLYLEGTDKLIGNDRLAGAKFAVRFHLGAGIRVRLDKPRRNAMLHMEDGAIWLFTLDKGPGLALEESVVLTPQRKLRRTAQVVIAGNTLTDDTIRWHIARHAAPLADDETDDAT